MPRRAHPNATVAFAVASMRRANHEARVANLRDGRRERAASFRAKKGKGSYRRWNDTPGRWSRSES